MAGRVKFDNIDATKPEIKFLDNLFSKHDKFSAEGGVGDVDRNGAVLEIETPVGATLFAVDEASFAIKHDDTIFAADMVERTETGGFRISEGGFEGGGKLVGGSDVSDSLAAEAVIWFQDNIVLMLFEIPLEVGRSIAAIGKLAMIVERIKNGVINNRNTGGAQNFKSSELIGGDSARGLRVEWKAILKHVANFTVLLETKKPASRKNLHINSLFLADIEDILAAHEVIITDYEGLWPILGGRLFLKEMLIGAVLAQRARVKVALVKEGREIFVGLVEAETGESKRGDGEQNRKNGAKNGDLRPLRGAGQRDIDGRLSIIGDDIVWFDRRYNIDPNEARRVVLRDWRLGDAEFVGDWRIGLGDEGCDELRREHTVVIFGFRRFLDNILFGAGRVLRYNRIQEAVTSENAGQKEGEIAKKNWFTAHNIVPNTTHI